GVKDCQGDNWWDKVGKGIGRHRGEERGMMLVCYLAGSGDRTLKEMYSVPRPLKIGMPRSCSGMIPGTKLELLKIAKTRQRARLYADRDPGHLLAFEIRW
ncbi:hypothetical protein Tco_1114813, partial [Tanacetum coccineum]